MVIPVNLFELLFKGTKEAFGREFELGSGRNVNLALAEAQRAAINTSITERASFQAGFNRGFAGASLAAQDRVANINNRFRNNQISAINNRIAFERNQIESNLTTLDKVQLGADIVGVSEIPIVSQVADLVSGGISLSQGDFVGAGLSAASTIPIIGKAAEGTRAARFAERVGNLAPRFRHSINGRLESAFAKIEPINIGAGTGTTEAARVLARSLGRITDDAGHAIGRNLGGLGGSTSGNIFPQAPGVNRGAFRQFEQQIAKQVQAGRETFVRVVPKFEGNATRPNEIVFQVRIDGKTITRTFDNP